MTRQLWGTPLIPALRKQRHADLCEFKDSLVYKANARTARTVSQKNLVSENHTNLPKRFICIACVWMFTLYMYAYHMHAVPAEVMKGHQIPWNWMYRCHRPLCRSW